MVIQPSFAFNPIARIALSDFHLNLPSAIQEFRIKLLQMCRVEVHINGLVFINQYVLNSSTQFVFGIEFQIEDCITCQNARLQNFNLVHNTF